MKQPTAKLDIAIAELSVLIKQQSADITEIKGRLTIMDENFARKDDVEKNAAGIIEMRNALQKLEIDRATDKATFQGKVDTLQGKIDTLKGQLRTWGIVGGLIVTFASSIIAALVERGKIL